MIFWITAIAMALICAAFLVVPVLHGRGRRADQPSDVAVYKAQLAEIDRDVVRGVLEEDAADRTRAEVSRRLIAAAKTTPLAEGSGPSGIVIALSVLIPLAVGVGVYTLVGAPGAPDQPLAQRHAEAEQQRLNRPSQAEMAAMAPPPPAVDAPEEYFESVEQLRAVMEERPNDPRGWELLAYHEIELRNYTAAAEAQERLIVLRGDPSTEDLTRLLDLLVAATDGRVSPEAEGVARLLLGQDRNDLAGRYYLGAMHNQNGRPDLAFRLWRPMVDAGDPGFHTALASSAIENAALRAGVEYTLPETRGPSMADIEAAEDLTNEERMEMIGGMVANLANRLATEGGPASDWARLIQSYASLGEVETAEMILNEATQVFSNDANGMAVLRDVAERMGLIP